jgi:hypothetical protein
MANEFGFGQDEHQVEEQLNADGSALATARGAQMRMPCENSR